jgi:hypothetical protein
MALSRRAFLQLAGGVCLADSMPTVPGDVVFCRVSCRTMPEAIEWLGSVFPGARPLAAHESTLRYRDFVAEYRPGSHRELVICGATSTLVLNPNGYRRHA